MDWKITSVLTGLYLMDKTLEEVGFPNEWKYNFVKRWWEKLSLKWKNSDGEIHLDYFILTDEMLDTMKAR